ncbi:MAG: biotin transporter BioY [Oscillospiraceae bacterium]|nr:biotin transporter BioY [Oscillospiraceae bacterium]
MNTRNTSFALRDMIYTAIYAAVLCAVAPLSISIGPIPFSFATMIIYLSAGSLGTKYGTASVGIYIVLGAIGLPVFSGFEGGFHKIAGMTGGFIIGYLPLAMVTGFMSDISNGSKLKIIFGMVIGTVLLYTCGVIWFLLQTRATLIVALTACVFPFLLGDAIKIVMTSLVIPQLKETLSRSRIRS